MICKAQSQEPQSSKQTTTPTTKNKRYFTSMNYGEDEQLHQQLQHDVQVVYSYDSGCVDDTVTGTTTNNNDNNSNDNTYHDNNYTDNNKYDNDHYHETIDALEQALKIQINKRIEMEMELQNTNNKLMDISNMYNKGKEKNDDEKIKDLVTNFYQEIKSLIENLSLSSDTFDKDDKKNNNIHSISSSSSSSPTKTTKTKSNENHNLLLQSLSDYSLLFSDFLSELDGLDGDTSEESVDRKDVLWFLKHELYDQFVNGIQCQVLNYWKEVDEFRYGLIRLLREFKKNVWLMIDDSSNYHRYCNGGGNVDGNVDGNVVGSNDKGGGEGGGGDDIDIDLDEYNDSNAVVDDACVHVIDSDWNIYQELTEREMIISKLQGRIVQLKEEISNQSLSPRYQTIINELQESIQAKNDEIYALKELLKEMENEIERLVMQLNNQLFKEEEVVELFEVEDVCPTTVHEEPFFEGEEVVQVKKVDDKKIVQGEENLSNQRIMHEEWLKIEHKQLLLCKDIEIKSLMEDIEERDIVIQEMKDELMKYKDEKVMNPLQHSDKVRLRYLEGIVRDLEYQLAKASGSSRNAIHYGSLAYFDLQDKNNLSNNSNGSDTSDSTSSTLVNSLNGGSLTIQKDLDMEKRCEELVEKLRRSEEEKENLRKELLTMRSMLGS